jgi:DNA-binding NarL/FixJ family response regulator
VEDEQEAFAAIMAGAQGYRSKQDVYAGEIMSLIQMLCHGEFVLRSALLGCLLPHWGSENG